MTLSCVKPTIYHSTTTCHRYRSIQLENCPAEIDGTVVAEGIKPDNAMASDTVYLTLTLFSFEKFCWL